MAVKKVAIYARLSVTTEESVSIRRQIESCKRHAEAKGWTVVAVEVDDGVSASRHRPEHRAGWRAILRHPEKYDAVMIWKVDRLARRVLDFLNADNTLNERGAALVAVDDQIDMTTPLGRALAVLLAVFAELEAGAISARVRAARETIIRDGRRAGGRPPFGWMNVPNPDGPGKVLAFDPDRIEVVQTMIDMVLEGASIYQVRKWLEKQGIAPRARERASGLWHDASVEAILRNPTLAGMVPYSPGRRPEDVVDPGAVLRDDDGVAVVDESISIIGTDERRRLLGVLDAAKLPGSRPRGDVEPILLDGLARCAACGSLLHRATAAKTYPAYRCGNRLCDEPVHVLRAPLEAAVEEQFLEAKGADFAVNLTEVISESGDRLGDIEEALHRAAAELVADDADEDEINARIRGLKVRRDEARALSEGPAAISWTYDTRTNSEAWFAAANVEDRNRVLRGALKGVSVRPAGKRGQRFDKTRIECDWIDVADAIEVTPLRGAPFRAPRG